MKDGAVVQQGTPEDIVLNPATDYVAEFTRAVPRAKVVRVGSLMKPVQGDTPVMAVAESTKVADAAPMFLQEAILRVENAQGNTLGHLHRDDVVALMLKG
jgi:glycine betaine/proline transport system ATP-binding protein